MVFTVTDLLEQAEENTSRNVTIFQKISDFSYIVRDSRGKTYPAESTSSFSIGNTVLIKNGIIIGRVKNPSGIKNFEV